VYFDAITLLNGRGVQVAALKKFKLCAAALVRERDLGKVFVVDLFDRHHDKPDFNGELFQPHQSGAPFNFGRSLACLRGIRKHHRFVHWSFEKVRID
jgi:hypothetical protein